MKTRCTGCAALAEVHYCGHYLGTVCETCASGETSARYLEQCQNCGHRQSFHGPFACFHWEHSEEPCPCSGFKGELS
jgi:hypothetical protein